MPYKQCRYIPGTSFCTAKLPAVLAHEAGKASIIVVNKWDLVDKETGTMEKMRKDVMRDLSFMSYAPIIFISAMTGQRIDSFLYPRVRRMGYCFCYIYRDTLFFYFLDHTGTHCVTWKRAL